MSVRSIINCSCTCKIRWSCLMLYLFSSVRPKIFFFLCFPLFTMPLSPFLLFCFEEMLFDHGSMFQSSFEAMSVCFYFYFINTIYLYTLIYLVMSSRSIFHIHIHPFLGEMGAERVCSADCNSWDWTSCAFSCIKMLVLEYCFTSKSVWRASVVPVTSLSYTSLKVWKITIFI